VALPAADAPACACGVMIPSDPSLRAEGLNVDEWSIVRFDGRVETITMRLESSAAFERAALIVPLPAEARFALGHDAVFDDMAERTAPRVERRKRYTFLEGSDDDETGGPAGGAAPDGGVEVVGSQDLGPLRVVTLRGDDAGLVRTWLSDHGFEPPEGIESLAQPYLDKGWVLAAVRLRGAGGREVRALQPLIMAFPAERAVFPMMGGEARVDVVTPEPVAVGGRPDEERLFAGPMPNGRYLTSFKALKDDAEFVGAERRDFQQVRYVYEEVDVTGRVLAAAGALVLLIAGGVFLLLRRRGATS
jgi:hypothetical protein